MASDGLEEQVLRALAARGLLGPEDLIPSGDGPPGDVTLDPREARWGHRVGALVAAGRLDERAVEAVLRELGAAPAALRPPAPREGGDADAYEVVRRIGAGAAGEVFLARDRRLGRDVALKMLNLEGLEHGTRFVREARAQARVAHGGICQVYDVGQRQGRSFIAMRFIDGPSLKEAAPRLTLTEKVAVVRLLALALHEAHRHGVIHRDVKPSNVLLETLPDGTLQPVLTDFGLARELGDAGELTASGSIVGTPSYMSPEQARGDVRVLDRRTDVYSLGATLYALLIGEPPFTGSAAVEIVLAVVQAEPVAPRRRVPGLPEDLETIVLKCLAKDPGERYPTALAVAEDLGRHLAGESILGRRVGLVGRGRRLVRVWPRAAALLALLALLIIGLAAAAVRAAVEARRQEARLGAQTELARRLGQEIQEMESGLRVERMLPLHDVGREEERVRARLAAMRARLTGGPDDAPVHDALGRGLLALGDAAGARTELEAALAAGDDGADLHAALGLALVQLHDAAVATARATGGPTWVAAQRTVLDAEYLDAARLHLLAARDAGTASAHLLEALVAQAGGDAEGGIAAARRLSREAPQRYEGQAVAGQILLDRALVARDRGDRGDADALFGEAIAAYEAAALVGRSDVAVYAPLAEAWIRRMENRRYGGRPVDLLPAALAAADRASAAAPARSVGDVRKAFAYLMAADLGTGAAAAGFYDRCAAAARAAAAKDPRDAMALDALGICLSLNGELVMNRGGDPTPQLAAAASALAQAQQLSPGFPWAANDLGIVYLFEAEDRLQAGQDPGPPARAARAALDRALALDPELEYAAANAILAVALEAEGLVARGRWDEALARRAEAYVEIGERLRPGAVNALLNVARLRAARLRHALAAGQDLDAAYAMVEEIRLRASASLPDDQELLAVAADARLQRGEDEARRGRPSAAWLAAARPPSARCAAVAPDYLPCLLVAVRIEWLAAAPASPARATGLLGALALAKRAVAAHPGSGRSHGALAETQRLLAEARPAERASHLAAGLASAEQALALAPDLASAWATRAGLELLAGSAETDPARRRAAAGRALAASERAIAADPLVAAAVQATRVRAAAIAQER